MASGVRGLLARWLGGAGTDTAQAGLRSLLAFWAGGATAATPVLPEPEQQPVSSAGGASVGGVYRIPVRSPHDVRGRFTADLHLGAAARGRVIPAPVHGSASASLDLSVSTSGRILNPVHGRLSAAVVLSVVASGRIDNNLPRARRDDEDVLLLLIS